MEIKLKIGAISRDNSEYCHYAIPENRAEDREKPRKISRIRAWGDRAEISPTPNIGYVRESGGGLALDPDEQAQQVVRLVFDQFDRQGSLHGLLRYLVHHSLRLPVRPHYGPNRGKLE